jgi:hypothetical protein
LWTAFEKERPCILGVLLDAVVEGLRMLPRTRLDKLPRMADFALWATACETALWPAGTFWTAYCGNRAEAVDGVIDADPVAAAVCAIMAGQTEWTGAASDLLGVLGDAVGETQRKAKTWPDSPRALAGRLRRAATFLRNVGIEVSFAREGRTRSRTIRIFTAAENSGTRRSAPSSSSAEILNANRCKDFAADTLQTIANCADGHADDRGADATASVRANPLKFNGMAAADHADANITHVSGPRKGDVSGSRVP